MQGRTVARRVHTDGCGLRVVNQRKLETPAEPILYLHTCEITYSMHFKARHACIQSP
jgi:hypothetical protein